MHSKGLLPSGGAASKARAMAAMECMGWGAFSGTLILVIPAAISASATGSTSCGVMPRRMATRGLVDMARAL